MSDERKRHDQWGALLDQWTDVAPSDGFADRVLAACDAGDDVPDLHAAPRVVPASALPRVVPASAPPRETPPRVTDLASARLVREAAPPRSLRGGVLLVAAVAALLLIIPFALRRGEHASSSQQPLTVAAGPPAYDLGPTRD